MPHLRRGTAARASTSARRWTVRHTRGAALSNERSDAAAEETRGVYLYYNGELVTNAVYYSCNGGASESCKNVWGSEVPYLPGQARSL